MHITLLVLLVAILTSPWSHGQDRKLESDLAIFDDIMVKFLVDHQVPGAALAIAKDGRLVYARGFGVADPQLGLPVEPRMRFRIASISKPITAAMILRLIEQGVLKMDDNPFAVLKIALPADADPRLHKVTIKHLLQHTGGWDREKSFDPMFRTAQIAKAQRIAPPAKPLDIIQYMTQRKLDLDPGERYAYANFGYCILGRVIEKVTVQSYEAAVQKHLFDPLGIHDAQLGQTLLTAKNEVRYFDEKNRMAKAVLGPNLGKPAPLPYGAWCLESMDSHGGWIASAPDLVRFASAFQAPERCKILKPESIKMMFARPDGPAGRDKDGKPRDFYYGCGWQVFRKGDAEKFSAWHAGGLAGSSTELVLRADGLCWAILFNTRKNANNQELVELAAPLLDRAARQVKRWPERNLFDSE
jgi:CubicO group peptidase (beta-lactamase class C family)